MSAESDWAVQLPSSIDTFGPRRVKPCRTELKLNSPQLFNRVTKRNKAQQSPLESQLFSHAPAANASTDTPTPLLNITILRYSGCFKPNTISGLISMPRVKSCRRPLVLSSQHKLTKRLMETLLLCMCWRKCLQGTELMIPQCLKGTYYENNTFPGIQGVVLCLWCSHTHTHFEKPLQVHDILSEVCMN